jgi:proline dehydrogenase
MSNRPTAPIFVDNPKFRSFFEKQGMKNSLVSRFIAGTSIREALLAGKEYQQQKFSCAFDLLGDDVLNVDEAERSTQSYLDLIRQISIFSPGSYVTLKLTSLGLNISDELARQNLHRITDEAAKRGSIFIRVDMEGSAYTSRILQITCEEHRLYPQIGASVQSNLRRTDKDLSLLIQEKVSLRLVKGPFQESPSVALTTKIDIESAFRKQMYLLLEQGVNPAIGTHDEEIIKVLKAFIKQNNIPLDRFEFEMLRGIRTDLQEKLVEAGYRVRIYIPFGTYWYPYFSRRIAERPANVGFALARLFR